MYGSTEKISGFKGNRTHDLCDAGVVLYQLSYEANYVGELSWVPFPLMPEIFSGDPYIY